MPKKTTKRPVRKRVTQCAVGDPIEMIDCPPQCRIDTVDVADVGNHNETFACLEHGIDQDSFAVYKGMGDTYLARGENDKAMAWFEKALECEPLSVAVIKSLGQVLVSLGREEESVRLFSSAISQQLDMGNVRLLIDSMGQMGLTDQAAEILEGLIEAHPNRSDIMFELAWFYEKIGHLSDAETWYSRHAALTHSFEAFNQLGLVCRSMGRISEAVEYLQQAVKLKPLQGGAWDNLAMCLMEFGYIEEGIDLSRIVVMNTPTVPKLHSNYLLRLHYSPTLDQQAIFEAHVEWGRRYAPISMARTFHGNPVDLHRRLRIGYISPDFARCVAVCYIASLLEAHNRDAVEVYGYGNVERPDETTAAIQTKFDHYRDIWNVDNEATARIIEQDNIDILVDLAGHTKNNCLQVLAYKPAPVQVTYLGYADTTGMEAVDYVLTDTVMIPPESQRFYTEERFPLPRYCSYKPFEEAPSVNPLPAAKRGYVTFGTFTNVWRLNARLWDAWADILNRTDNAKLIVGCRSGNDEPFRRGLLSQFEQRGIARERIDIRGIKPYPDYLKQYNEVDIVLDTFPENGGTTTCDALWMGVPVISLTGQHQVERTGLSILRSIGMDSFATATPSDYVAKAVAISNATENLITMRKSLRRRMAESVLCDLDGFAREIESAFRDMWHRWCQKQGGSERRTGEKKRATIGVPDASISDMPQSLADAVDAAKAEDRGKGIEQDSVAAYKGLGDTYASQGQHEEAVKWLDKALACQPDSISILESMGRSLVSLGRDEEAVEHFRIAIRQQTDLKGLRTLTEAMRRIGLTERVIEILENILHVNPQLSEIMFELAWFLQSIGRLDQAEAWYKKTADHTQSGEAYNQLGIVCRNRGRISDAVTYMRKAVALKPDLVCGWRNLAHFLMESGSTEESLELLRTLVDKMPNDSRIHSILLFSLHYTPELNRQAIFQEHKKWGQRHAPLSMAKISHGNTVDPDRTLRIGYISPDFTHHIVMCYMDVLLASHNRDEMEIYGYGNVERPNETTATIQNKFDHYRDIWELDDDAVARLIEQDKIDILVDLAGHTKNNCLHVLAYKPAPIQVTYLGYADTTGMEAIDYLLTDNIVTPPDSQAFYTEELFPLTRCSCYRPLVNAPAIHAAPILKKGHVTFGAFTCVWRLNRRVLKAWADILKRTDHAGLILGFRRSGDDEGVRQRFLRQFEDLGIPRERIELRGAKPYDLYMKQYNDVDIVLDTFPENGGTTTCDALWMGVPVISLVGQHQVGRYGLSHLSSLGLEHLTATTAADYVTRAVTLANDRASLVEMRESMRARMAASPLCDSRQFACSLESAYREMWHRWCRTQGLNVPARQSSTGSRLIFGHKDGIPSALTHPVSTEPPRSQGTPPQSRVQTKMQMTIAEDMPRCLVQANTAIRMGRVEEAKGIVNDQAIAEVCQRLETDPSRTDIMLLLGTVLNGIGQKREAYTWYERCAAVEPNALAYNEMAMIDASRGLLTECIESLRKAMKIDPDIPAIWVNLATRLMERNQLTEGFDLLHRAIQREPDNPVFFSLYLFSLNYLPGVDPQTIFALHKQWGKAHAPVSMASTSHDNDPVADRRLRIGYISPDFRGHAVTRFFEPILNGHDRNRVDVYGYGNVGRPDRTTDRLKGKFDHYRNIFGTDDETVARLIRQDQIDILVELAGHTKNNRLLVLAHKPAPIQVTYLGYGDTTGMEAVDYLFSDLKSIPPESQEFYTERVMYLPGAHFCFQPPDRDIAVTPPPCVENGYMTFGSMMPPRRFNLNLLKVWADILTQVPNARMVLGFSGGMDDGIRRQYLTEFKERGVSPERIEIHGSRPYTEYLKGYSHIDVLLDPFPENGGTYTCEALWMGVPVITLAGQRQIHRIGLSILSRVNLERLVATTPSDYIAKAVSLANDTATLVELRTSMRSRIIGSPLCDAKQFTRNLESAYREMWHRWCQSQVVTASTA